MSNYVYIIISKTHHENIDILGIYSDFAISLQVIENIISKDAYSDELQIRKYKTETRFDWLDNNYELMFIKLKRD